MEKDVNSHIQLPRLILEQFKDQSQGMVWYYNCQTDYYSRCGVKKLGTEKGYYSRKIEKRLSDSIESPFATLIHRMLKSIECKEGFIVFSPEDEKLVIDYVCILMSRSKLMHQEAKNGSEFSLFLPPKLLHDISVMTGFKASNNNVLSGWKVGIIHINGDRTLIVPRNGFYSIKREKEDVMVVPVSPQIAFVLSKEQAYYDLVCDNQSITRLNLRALVYEKEYNNEFIAANNKAELEKTVKIYKELIENIN